VSVCLSDMWWIGEDSWLLRSWSNPHPRANGAFIHHSGTFGSGSEGSWAHFLSLVWLWQDTTPFTSWKNVKGSAVPFTSTTHTRHTSLKDWYRQIRIHCHRCLMLNLMTVIWQKNNILDNFQTDKRVIYSNCA